MTPGEKLKQLRLEKNLSQVELAKILGIGQTTLSQYELGKRKISARALLKISELFSVPPLWLSGDFEAAEIAYKSTNEKSIMDLTENAEVFHAIDNIPYWKLWCMLYAFENISFDSDNLERIAIKKEVMENDSPEKINMLKQLFSMLESIDNTNKNE